MSMFDVSEANLFKKIIKITNSRSSVNGWNSFGKGKIDVVLALAPSSYCRLMCLLCGRIHHHKFDLRSLHEPRNSQRLDGSRQRALSSGGTFFSHIFAVVDLLSL